MDMLYSRARLTRSTLPLLIALAMLVSGCARNMMATPLLYRDSPTPVFGELAPELQGDGMSIFYATDRTPASSDPKAKRFYGSGRSPSGALGIAEVEVGEGAGSWQARAAKGAIGDRPAERVRPSSMEVISANELVRFPATPYLYQVDSQGRITPDPEVAAELKAATFAARREIIRHLALTPKKEVFVFVHGVANQFEDAVLGTAEYWHFLGREGVPISYTWPAGAKGLIFYTVDRESGEFTVLHLKQFLRILADIPEIEKIHIAAHSRGTDVATTALRELVIESRAKGEDPRKRYRIENLVLVAADLDLEVSMQRLIGEAIAPAIGLVTIYTNANDSALATAKALFHSRQRVGALTPTELTVRQQELVQRIANLDIIVYEGGGGGIFRHGYFRDPVASSDMIMLLRYGWRPGEGKRQGLERVSPKIWRLNGGGSSS